MQFDRGYISPYFSTNADKMRVEMDDPISDLREKLSGLQNFFRCWKPSCRLEPLVSWRGR